MSRFHSLAQGYVVTEPVQKIDNKLTTILYTHRYLDRQTTSELQTKWIKIRDIKIGPRLLLITNRSLICFIKERMMMRMRMRMRMRMMMMMMMMMDVAYALSIGNKINDLGMTLNWPWTAIMRFVALQICISEPATKNWMKIDPNYQRQKCNPGSLFLARFGRIFAGVRCRVTGHIVRRAKASDSWQDTINKLRTTSDNVSYAINKGAKCPRH